MNMDRRGSADELYFGEEEGESMVGFDVNRREELVRGARVDGDGGRGRDSERRLSRDLERGFRDSSEDEGSGDERRL